MKNSVKIALAILVMVVAVSSKYVWPHRAAAATSDSWVSFNGSVNTETTVMTATGASTKIGIKYLVVQSDTTGAVVFKSNTGGTTILTVPVVANVKTILDEKFFNNGGRGGVDAAIGLQTTTAGHLISATQSGATITLSARVANY